ncbi:hypothetical protein EYF80_010939 [Liparis tanakae]|uniref:Uncharacterized protein n=1 Tax=Liparis tanakae TaxID=230148 RepID=A0A4Z2IL62_9TELE|nr:hypothetical protein EYF80_010939 [Liparis tanakae]
MSTNRKSADNKGSSNKGMTHYPPHNTIRTEILSAERCETKGAGVCVGSLWTSVFPGLGMQEVRQTKREGEELRRELAG